MVSKTVPEGWENRRLADIAFITMGQSPSSKDVNDSGNGIPFLQGNAEFNAQYPAPVKWCSTPLKLADKGNVLMSVRAPVGALNMADQQYCIGRGLAAIRFTNAIAAFGWYALLKNVRQLCNVSQGSTFGAISKKHLETLEFLLPPIPEQRKIAAILLSVDDAIEKTKAVIEQTKVIKKGLMQELLTRGIPGRHKKFKKTPIGEIPEEWEVVRLKNIASLITSGSRGWAQYCSDSGPLFLRIGNLTRDHINLRLENLMHVNLPENTEGTRAFVAEGDILISITADLGVIGIIPEGFGEAYVNQHIALVKFNSTNFYPRWIAHFLSSNVGQRQIQKMNDSGSKAGLNLNTIANLRIALPDKNEQKNIAALIGDIDKYIEDGINIITSFQNLKSALMQVLLSGEKRVEV